MALSRTRRRLVERLRSSRFRPREGLFLVEGVRTADEALDAGLPVRFALLSPRLDTLEGGGRLRARVRDRGIDPVEVSDDELEEVSDTETPQGVLLVCEEPDGGLDTLGAELAEPSAPAVELAEAAAPAAPGGVAPPPFSLLIADGVQDPGNLGTLLRSARAFGVSGVLALDGTVDPWNSKVVRAAAGASFHLPVVRASWNEARLWLDEREVELLAAAMEGEDVGAVRPTGRWALAVGNEGAGLRPALAGAARPVAVPMPGGGESLNVGVAGSILLFALSGHD